MSDRSYPPAELARPRTSTAGVPSQRRTPPAHEPSRGGPLLPRTLLTAATGALLVALALPAPDLRAQAADLNVDGDPFFETLSLTTGFSGDPRTITLRAGGGVSARGLGPGCVGNIGSRPDVRLDYEAGSLFPLNIYAESDDADLTLVILRPDGTWICNDDHEGLNPAVLMESPQSGRYDIWVGVFSGNTAPASLHISELSPRWGNPGSTAGATSASDDGPALDFHGAPYFETIHLTTGFTPDPRIVEIDAGGSQSARGLGSGCRGDIGVRPDVRLHYEAGRVFPLHIYATSDTDLTLVVRDPAGEWHCNDDYDGLDPAIRLENPRSGTYEIWVGVYRGFLSESGTDLAEALVAISELTPDFEDLRRRNRR